MKVRYEEWYLYNYCENFIKEIDFLYDTYINKIEKVYSEPEEEAEIYRIYLLGNLSEVNAISEENQELELEGMVFQRYNLIKNIKYRNLVSYISTAFEMLEQFLISITRKQLNYCSMDKEYIKEAKTNYLSDIEKVFIKYNYNFSNNKYYDKIKELNLLNNVIKHAEGQSEKKLRVIRPQIFEKNNHDIIKFYNNTIIDDTLNLTNDDFKEYTDAIKGFLREFPEKMSYEYNIE